MWFPSNADIVYHYTDAAGLLGILDTSRAHQIGPRMIGGPPGNGAFSMRFTDALYLNDPQELQFGGRILAQHLRAVIPAAGGELDIFAEILEWLDSDEAIASNALSGEWSGAYVASFSRDADSLSQWRNYAGGRGYAIGFDMNALKLLTPLVPEDPGASDDDIREMAQGLAGLVTPMVGDVQYGPEGMEKAFEQMAPLIVETPPDQRVYMVQAALAQVKQLAYQGESEVRAFILRGPVPFDLQFRPGAMGVTPYITASYLPTGPHGYPPLVREIWVGPGEDIGARQAAVKQLLQSVGFASTPVEPSAIRFRG